MMKYGVLLLVLTALTGCIGGISVKTFNKKAEAKSDDELAFDEKMTAFKNNESMALEIYQLPATTTKETILYEIKDRGIYYWNENLAIVDELEKMDFNPRLKARLPKLREYCELRIDAYEYYYNIIARDEQPKKYEKEIHKMDLELEQVLAALEAD